MDNKDKRDMLPEDEYLKQMSSLPKVKAPDDFLQKVRARIERRPLRERIIDALFVPFRIKIPLEVAAVTATLLLVMSSFDEIRPSKQLASVPKSDVEEAVVGKADDYKYQVYANKGRDEEKSEVILDKIESGTAPAVQAAPAATEGLKMKKVEYKESRLCEREASRGFLRADALPAIKGYIESSQGVITHIESDKNSGKTLYIDAEIPAASYESFKKKIEDPAVSRNIRVEPILKDPPQGSNIIQIRIFMI
ncbi:MAG TPA: hypothetical protein PLV09_01610 [Candidatus Omnitrophota bacterium]|nr:hypothetical protein [Candidatus Omnitrophota bacterium]HPN66098.1 hypothetical protein [Candidatus Omnitrophota bacterium]HRZ67725.1 hypothetical protein [Candidatus Omnitrophota bacterium]